MGHNPEIDLNALNSLTDEEIQEAIALDPDAAPELDEAAFAAFCPAEEVLPALIAAYHAGALRSNE